MIIVNVEIITYLLSIFCVLILINLTVMRIYSQIARKKYLQRKKQDSLKPSGGQENQKTGKSLMQIIKEYLSSWLRYNLFLLGYFPSHRIRRFIYKNVFLIKIGKNSTIQSGAEILSPWNISIGDGSVISQDCKIDGRNGLTIGNNANISAGVWIFTAGHDINNPYYRGSEDEGTVIIGDRTWISLRAIILPKTEIKEGAVVAAGAVVTKDCDAFGLYAGIPAKKIAERNKNLLYNLDFSWLHFY